MKLTKIVALTAVGFCAGMHFSDYNLTRKAEESYQLKPKGTTADIIWNDGKGEFIPHFCDLKNESYNEKRCEQWYGKQGLKPPEYTREGGQESW